MSSTLTPDPAQRPAPDGTPDQGLVQLSVHSLPSPHEAQRTRQGRLKMLLVLAICAAPVVASYLTFYVIRPQGRLNYGTLIEPHQPLPSAQALPLKGPDGRSVVPAALKGQWLLITVAGGDCDQPCEKQLYWQRQIRESLGKDKDKLDRVWLINDERPMRDALAAAMQDATVLHVPGPALAAWLKPEAGHALSDHWYLVDPRGDWMMRFPAQAEPRKVQKDLTRLIKAATAWDNPGRP